MSERPDTRSGMAHPISLHKRRRETDRETERQRGREAERQRGRERPIDRETERQIERRLETMTHPTSLHKIQH